VEGIGAAEIVLVNRRELRDALISEQSSERQRVGWIGSGLHTRSTGLLRRSLVWSTGRRRLRIVNAGVSGSVGGALPMDGERGQRPLSSVQSRVQRRRGIIFEIPCVCVNADAAGESHFEKSRHPSARSTSRHPLHHR